MSAALERFAAELAREEAEIGLARACLMVAEDACPRLDIEHYLGELDRLGAQLRRRRGVDGGPEQRVLALNTFLFDELGYAGNEDEYYDPRNSYLNEVIDRRTGIPITLSVVYIEIGRRIGLPLEGVSFPGHFLVRYRMRGGMLVLDPFAAGAMLSEDELRERLERVAAGAFGRVPRQALSLEQFLEPAGVRQIVARVLRNLKGIWAQADKPQRLLEVLNRLVIAVPEAVTELRDRGYAFRSLEAFRAALADLNAYLERAPDAADADEVRAAIIDLSARCARLN